MEAVTTLVHVLELGRISLDKHVSDKSLSEEGRILLQLVIIHLRERRQVVERMRAIKELVGGMDGTLGQLALHLLLLADFTVLLQVDILVGERRINTCDIGGPERVGVLGGSEFCELAVDHDTECVSSILMQTDNVECYCMYRLMMREKKSMKLETKAG